MLPLSNTPNQREREVLVGVISGCPGGVFEKSCEGNQVLEKREGENSAIGS